MAFLSRAAILEKDDRKKVTVEIEEWGGEVVVASMSARERLEYEALLARYQAGEKEVDFIGFLVVSCLFDGDGKKLFTIDDLEPLKDKNPAVLMRLFRKAAELNVLTTEAAEEQAGNSEASRG